MKIRCFSYWVLPIISGLVWLATLLGLLLYWIVDAHRIKYPSMEGSMAYISDVGAFRLKPLFITGCVITVVFLNLSLVADRWLRHRRRLVPYLSTGERVLMGLTLFFAIVGMVGLILLSVYDTNLHKNIHQLCLALFIGGYLISAVFVCWEYQRLGIHYREHLILRLSFWIKLTFILVELGLCIAFGVLSSKHDYTNAAIVEWTIAFTFSFYVFTFAIDLWPAIYTQPENGFRDRLRARKEGRESQMEEADVRVSAVPEAHLSNGTAR